jgi:hypothetical protein
MSYENGRALAIASAPLMREPPPLAPLSIGVPTQNMALGDPQNNYMILGLDRSTSGPEDANADYSQASPEVYHRSAVLQVPSVVWMQGTGLVTRADYNVLANYQYFRAGMDLVNAMGRNDQAEQIAWTADGLTFSVSGPAAPNLVLGVIIEWSLQLQVSSAFTMRIATTGFQAMSFQDLNRVIDLRLGPGTTPDSMAFANGGMFAFLFGQRMSTNDTCGCTGGSGCVTNGSGGMMKAVVQPAWIAPANPPDYIDPEVTTSLTPYIAGLTAPFGTNQSNGGPRIDITVPGTIGAGFGYVARYLTAASPAMAGVQQALRASGVGLTLGT